MPDRFDFAEHDRKRRPRSREPFLVPARTYSGENIPRYREVAGYMGTNPNRPVVMRGSMYALKCKYGKLNYVRMVADRKLRMIDFTSFNYARVHDLNIVFGIWARRRGIMAYGLGRDDAIAYPCRELGMAWVRGEYKRTNYFALRRWCENRKKERYQARIDRLFQAERDVASVERLISDIRRKINEGHGSATQKDVAALAAGGQRNSDGARGARSHRTRADNP